MKYEVIIEAAAHQSIMRNALWWSENHSPDQALEWQRLIYQQLAELAAMPERHGLARENDDFPFDLRQKLVGKGKHPTYRALFAIKDSKVHVLEFLAAEQDDWQVPE